MNRDTPIHPLWLRLTHWLNALAVLVMVTSGWRIYNASPLFDVRASRAALTLGGWLGGALQWHFAAMWLLAANGLVYLGTEPGHRAASAASSSRFAARGVARPARRRCAAGSRTTTCATTTPCSALAYCSSSATSFCWCCPGW